MYESVLSVTRTRSLRTRCWLCSQTRRLTLEDEPSRPAVSVTHRSCCQSGHHHTLERQAAGAKRAGGGEGGEGVGGGGSSGRAGGGVMTFGHTPPALPGFKDNYDALSAAGWSVVGVSSELPWAVLSLSVDHCFRTATASSPTILHEVSGRRNDDSALIWLQVGSAGRTARMEEEAELSGNPQLLTHAHSSPLLLPPPPCCCCYF